MPTVVYGSCSPTTADGQLSTLQKILQCGAGGTGGVSSGSGPPGASTDGNWYIDDLNRDIYVKISGVWEIAIDLV